MNYLRHVASALAVLVVMSATALADDSPDGYVHGAPAPEISGGLVGFALAGGMVYLLKRQRRA